MVSSGFAHSFRHGKGASIFVNDFIDGSRHSHQANACKVKTYELVASTTTTIAIYILVFFLVLYFIAVLFVLCDRITNGIPQVLKLFQNKAFTCEYK